MCSRITVGRPATARAGPGFPDLVLAGRERVLFAELKRLYQAQAAESGYGVPSPEQVMWAERLRGSAEYLL